MSFTPVQALLEILRTEGVDRVFGNPGTTELPFTDALAQAPDLPYILGLQESGVVAMADGYARATGRPAFVNLHVAAGVANGLIGLLNARRSRTPLVVTAGQQDRRHLVYDPMLAGDLVGITRSVVKSAVEVQHARDLPVLMRRAFAEAVRAPAGPVFVSIPMDLLAEESIVDVPARSAPVTPGVADGIPAAAQVLAGAQRPVLIAGDGVGRENAVEELVAVAEALGAAVYHQPMADGINFPGNHPLYHGMPLPTTAAVRALLAEHDVAFVVGTHAFPAHHYTPDRPVPDGVRVVQMDSDPAQLGRNFPVEVALYGALPASLHALADRLRGKVPDAQRRGSELGAATRAARDEIDASARKRWGPGPMDPLAAVHAIATALPAGAVVIEEGITAGMLLRRVLRQDRPGSYRHAIGGGLGWGIGAAIGTRMGAPDRPVVAVVGDGCATFGLQALWTAAHHRIPVTFVVINNGEYRTLKDTLDRNKSRSTQLRRYVGLDLREPALDWRGAGAFFGVPVVRPAGCAELAELVAESSTLDGPRLVEVPVTGHPGGSL